MRSLKNEAKVVKRSEMVPDARYQLELFEAELQSEESWKEAIKGCRYMFII